MSEEPKPIGLYTVNICNIDGPVAKVCGVESEDLRKDLIRYSEKLDAKKDLDWYQLDKKFKIEDVVRYAKQLDETPLIFNVAGESINVRETFTVLVYVMDRVHKLCVMKEPEQKQSLEFYITHSNIKGKKEVDWYQVENAAQVDDIVEFTKGNNVKGVVYDLVRE